jgi:hypothetical protein
VNDGSRTIEVDTMVVAGTVVPVVGTGAVVSAALDGGGMGAARRVDLVAVWADVDAGGSACSPPEQAAAVTNNTAPKAPRRAPACLAHQARSPWRSSTPSSTSGAATAASK